MDESQTKPTGFNFQWLPWVVAAVGLLVYLVTLNHWLSLSSVAPSAQALGVDWWNLKSEKPLYLLLALPVRLLPLAWQIPALNVVAAVLGALTLAVIARSVAIFPQDRTYDQRLRNRDERGFLQINNSWLPPVAAALVCGLQLTFWEHSTVGTGEMLDAFIFAVLIGCLLEYRISRRDGWLFGFALLLGISIANNWGMIGFAPLFLVALIWIKGRELFRRRFILYSLGLGIAGLLVYLVNPVLGMMNPVNQDSFWVLLKWQFVAQREPLLLYPRGRVILLSLTSILPLLVISIKWPSNFGDVSGFGIAMTNFLVRLVHLIFLGVCVWIAFDPVFSPRELGYGLAMIPFYYLGALAVGYLCGYVMLVCGIEPEQKWRRPPIVIRALNVILLLVIWVGLLAVPALLIRKNLPTVRAENGPLLKLFARDIAAGFPAGSVVFMSANPVVLLLMEIHSRGTDSPPVFADRRWLAKSIYHRKAAARYPGRWPVPRTVKVDREASPALVTAFLAGLAGQNTLCGLEYEMGSLLNEAFYPEQVGLLFHYRQYTVGSVFPPKQSEVRIAAEQSHWGSLDDKFARLEQSLTTKSGTAMRLAGLYSMALNHRGVELQKLGRLKEADSFFKKSLTLNAKNFCAVINREVNQDLVAGTPAVAESTQKLPGQVSEAQGWGALFGNNGPIDEPSVRTFVGQILLQKEMLRQSIHEFARAGELNATNVVSRVFLADAYLRGQLPDEARAIVKELEENERLKTHLANVKPDLLRLKGLFAFKDGNALEAERLLRSAITNAPGFGPAYKSLFEILLFTGQDTNAYEIVQQHLKVAPDDGRALLNSCAILVRLGRPQEALAPINQLLKSQTNNAAAYYNRAVAYLNLAEWAKAKTDYNTTLDLNPGFFQAHLGLSEVAEKSGDKADAIRRLEIALNMIPPKAAEREKIEKKLATLKGEAKP